MIWELMSENLQVFSLSVKEAEVSQGKFGSGWTKDDGDGDGDGGFPSFLTECPSRPLHLHLRAGAVLVCPGPAGDAG